MDVEDKVDAEEWMNKDDRSNMDDQSNHDNMSKPDDPSNIVKWSNMDDHVVLVFECTMNQTVLMVDLNLMLVKQYRAVLMIQVILT